MTGIPRGIRNNNPGNMKLSPIKWQGQVPVDEQTDEVFYQFQRDFYGIRAMAIELGNYQKHDGCTCIVQFINRWAPSSENATEAYIKHCVSLTGIDRYQPLNTLDYSDCRKLVLAIIRHENGQMPYSDSVIDKALSMAGLDRPEQAG